MIIGITGKYCVGKDVASEYLSSKCFVHYSLSDILRDEARERRVVPDRKTLICIGNELRQAYGPGILARKTMDKFEAGKHYVISSIRNPSEVGELRRCPGFTLVGIDAPVGLRWQRMQERADKPDNISTYEEFVVSEQSEQSEDPNKQQLHLVFTLADIIIINDTTKDRLYSQLDVLIS